MRSLPENNSNFLDADIIQNQRKREIRTKERKKERKKEKERDRKRKK